MRKLVKVNFGSSGSTYASAVVVATDVLAGARPLAWLFPKATSDHTVDEHVLAPVRVVAGEATAGVGFTVYAVLDPASPSARKGSVPTLTGTWFVAVDY